MGAAGIALVSVARVRAAAARGRGGALVWPTCRWRAHRRPFSLESGRIPFGPVALAAPSAWAGAAWAGAAGAGAARTGAFVVAARAAAAAATAAALAVVAEVPLCPWIAILAIGNLVAVLAVDLPISF